MPALESCPAVPKSPVFMFVLVARWPPPSTLSYILSNQAMASGNEGQGHLLIGCRCWAFDWQEGNAVSAGACQLSSCSEKTLQTHGGLLTQHVNIIYRNSKASLLSHRPCYSFPKSFLTQPHIFHKASQYTSYWWTYANIVKWKDQKEGSEEKKEQISANLLVCLVVLWVQSHLVSLCGPIICT